MKKYRIAQVDYESGSTQFLIEFKFLFWWIEEERWNSLSYAQNRLKEITQYKSISKKEVVS